MQAPGFIFSLNSIIIPHTMHTTKTISHTITLTPLLQYTNSHPSYNVNRKYTTLTSSNRVARNPKHIIVQWVCINTHTHTHTYRVQRFSLSLSLSLSLSHLWSLQDQSLPNNRSPTLPILNTPSPTSNSRPFNIFINIFQPFLPWSTNASFPSWFSIMNFFN